MGVVALLLRVARLHGAPMKSLVALVGPAFVLMSCLAPVCETTTGQCERELDDGGTLVCADYNGAPGDRVCVTVGPVVCAGQTCGKGEFCCLPTGRCEQDGRACRENSPVAQGCVSNADCAPDEACFGSPAGPAACATPGACQKKTTCGTCEPADGWQCAACGCDGRTYAGLQGACVAGVRIAAWGACGSLKNPEHVAAADGGSPRYSCGMDSQCPTGLRCCHIQGECFDPAEPWRCQLQSDGGLLNCISSDECVFPYSSTYCQRAQGCSGPGICLGAIRECGGEVAPVCGCDGVKYTNACWAAHAATSVGAPNTCP
jgi:hypothetical protein